MDETITNILHKLYKIINTIITHRFEIQHMKFYITIIQMRFWYYLGSAVFTEIAIILKALVELRYLVSVAKDN